MRILGGAVTPSSGCTLQARPEHANVRADASQRVERGAAADEKPLLVELPPTSVTPTESWPASSTAIGGCS